MIETYHPQISVFRQCELIALPRASYYYHSVHTGLENAMPTGRQAENLRYMELIDRKYTERPFYGSRRMTHYLNSQGYQVNRKRVQRLMQIMGLEAIYPRPRTSKAAPDHKVYPYLLRGLSIDRVDQVWCADITYIPLTYGFMFLVAIMDWFSRFVLSWRLSNTLESDFCLAALEEALSLGCPDIFNTDQGTQFTCNDFTGRLTDAQIKISMDGRGRAMDNVFVERLWRSVKYEDIYIKAYPSVVELQKGLKQYFNFYNYERPHQSLGYRPPSTIYFKDERDILLQVNKLRSGKVLIN
jgi:putative transposase